MKMSVQAMFDLGVQCLRAVNVPEKTAQSVSKALLKAELDGMPSHGFVRIPFYAAQVRSGKLRVWVRPVVTHPAPATTLVNARYGFAFPAIEEGLELAVPLARQYGIALLGVQHSHHCGMLGHYVEDVARQGLVCLAFSNTPAAMAPWGGRRASFGTNPLAFALRFIDTWVVMPGLTGCILTGLFYSLFTSIGFVHFFWIGYKWLISLCTAFWGTLFWSSYGNELISLAESYGLSPLLLFIRSCLLPESF